MSGKCSFLSSSAYSVQSLACCRMPCFFVLPVAVLVVPSLTNCMKVMPVYPLGCTFFHSSSCIWASSLDTISWRHFYLPWVRATLHEDNMWSRVPLYSQILQFVLSVRYLGRWLLVKVHNCLLSHLHLEHSKDFRYVVYVWLLNALASWWLNYWVSWFWGLYKCAILLSLYLKRSIHDLSRHVEMFSFVIS